MKNKKRLSKPLPVSLSDPKISTALSLARLRNRLAAKLTRWKENALSREIGRVSKATGLRRDVVEQIYQETPRIEAQNRCVEMAENRKNDRKLFIRPKSEKFVEAARKLSKAARSSGSDLERVNASLKEASAGFAAFGSYVRAAAVAPEWCKALALETVHGLSFVLDVATEWGFDEDATRFALRYAEAGAPLPTRDHVKRRAALDIETSLAAGNMLAFHSFAQTVRAAPFYGEIHICPRLQPQIAKLALASATRGYGDFTALPDSPKFTFTSPKK